MSGSQGKGKKNRFLPQNSGHRWWVGQGVCVSCENPIATFSPEVTKPPLVECPVCKTYTVVLRVVTYDCR